MDDRQPSKRRKLAAQEMEKDLNRSSLRPHGSVGRPSHDKPPPTSSVGPTTIQPLPSNETGQCASTARSALLQTPQRASSMTGRPIPACEVPTLRGMSMGRVMVAVWPPDSICRWSTTTRLPPGQSGITTTRGRPQGRQLLGTRTAVLAPAPEAPAFGRPSTAARERASPRKPLIESRASWRGWSVTWWPRLPLRWRRLRPITRRSIRVSFTRFIFILNCYKFARILWFSMSLGDLPLYSVYGKIWVATLMARPSWFRFWLVQRRLLRVSNHISFT
jgi:hypothetical protein